MEMNENQELTVGGEPIRPSGSRVCIECECEITEANYSGWQRFKEGEGGKTFPVCIHCEEKSEGFVAMAD